MSAFCNAGFDNLGSSSLKDFMLNPTLNVIITFLIISGGLGFAVWVDLGVAFKNTFLKDLIVMVQPFVSYPINLD